ncbi:DUF3348 domain-containing protein [Ideonella sp.]|uniref:DUF3348 domain-containing protein n=1 Tax=Ideonella sp. TaxID=1929293 RepID=UPI0035B28898
MVRGSQRNGLTGTALIRLLARLSDADAPESKQAFAERLSQWLGWTDAISLSAALNGGPATGRPGARASVSAEEAEVQRVRAALARAVADDGAANTDQKRMNLHAATDVAPMTNTADFSPHRRRYLAQQQAMEAGIGPLRERLRARLAGRSAAMAQLAAVDAVMEQVLGAREYQLLSTVPALLEKHFKRLYQAEQADQAAQASAVVPDDATDNAPDVAQAPFEPSAAPPGAWLDTFRQDMRSVLLAELDLRMQPVEGLLEALRMP